MTCPLATFSYRVTVIRNLPQLQKLDNLPVQPDEMADAMRRGMELVHPLEREPGPQPAYQQQQQHYRPPQVGSMSGVGQSLATLSKHFHK